MENKAILFDVDHTLIYGPEAEAYYLEHYLPALERVLSEALSVPLEEGKRIANDFRAKHDGKGELALERYGIGDEPWYDALCSLEPAQCLVKLPQVPKILEELKQGSWRLAAASDSPTIHILKTLGAIGVNSEVFDVTVGWERGMPRPKGGSSLVYEKILEDLRIRPANAYVVGDSLQDDVIAAERSGLNGVHIDPKHISTHRLRIASIEELPELLSARA